MCGRFKLTAWSAEVTDLHELFGGGRWSTRQPRYNVAPTQEVAIIRAVPADPLRRELVDIPWGLPAPWDPNKRLINAKAETVDQLASFRDGFARRRCLVISDGWYEFEAVNGKKLPWLYTLGNGGPFAFAGLWTKARAANGEPLEACVIITVPANDLAGKIHPRMPAILDPADYETWLDAKTPTVQLKKMLRPYDAARLKAQRVSTMVNNARNDVPECVMPV
jgi:putative SOS response-associated peptidase YedK